jgi:hypothetical protein
MSGTSSNINGLAGWGANPYSLATLYQTNPQAAQALQRQALGQQLALSGVDQGPTRPMGAYSAIGRAILGAALMRQGQDGITAATQSSDSNLQNAITNDQRFISQNYGQPLTPGSTGGSSGAASGTSGAQSFVTPGGFAAPRSGGQATWAPGATARNQAGQRIQWSGSTWTPIGGPSGNSSATGS